MGQGNWRRCQAFALNCVKYHGIGPGNLAKIDVDLRRMSFQPVIIPPQCTFSKMSPAADSGVTALLKNDPEDLLDGVEWYENGQLKVAKSNEVKFDGSDLIRVYLR